MTPPQGASKDVPQLARVAAGPSDPPVAEDAGDVIDYVAIRKYAGLVLRAPFRRRRIAAAAFVAVVALTFVALWALPKSYHVRTRLLAQRNPVMAALANPNLGRPFEADTPTRAARDTVLRWDNLVQLVKEADLVKRQRATRAPALRVVDAVREGTRRLLRRPEEDATAALAYTLEQKLLVEVGDGFVNISVEWPDGPTAYRIVEDALQNFLEARHASEISIVGEAISILQGHADLVRSEIAKLQAQVAQVERGTTAAAKPATAARPAEPGARTAGSDAVELARLRTIVAAKQRALTDLEQFRQRRVTELQTQLTQERTVYAEGHPIVASTQQSIEALSSSSPQTEALRAELADLDRELRRRTGGAAGADSPPARDPLGRAEPAARQPGPRNPEDPRLGGLRDQLNMLYGKYATLADRLDNARVEMDTAQAAFKYRYIVVVPPQLPTAAKKPKAGLVVAAGLLGGLLFAFFAATVAELRSDRIVEAWQIERRLGVPFLGSLRRGPPR